jgi:hypothetical protein
MRYIKEQQENIVCVIDEYELGARAMNKLLEDKKLHLEIRKKVNKRTRSEQKSYDEITDQLKNEVIKIYTKSVEKIYDIFLCKSKYIQWQLEKISLIENDHNVEYMTII